jgi:hypothetical protein
MCWALGSRAWATRRGPPWAAHLGFCRRAQTKWVSLIDPLLQLSWCCFQAVEACEDVPCPALGRQLPGESNKIQRGVCARGTDLEPRLFRPLSHPQLLSPGQDDPRAIGPCVPRIPSWVRQLAERSANLLSSCAPCPAPGDMQLGCPLKALSETPRSSCRAGPASSGRRWQSSMAGRRRQKPMEALNLAGSVA